MSSTAALFDLIRVHVRAAVAWKRDVLRRVGVLPPSQDGMFDNLADELFARWPAEAEALAAPRRLRARAPGTPPRLAELCRPDSDDSRLPASRAELSWLESSAQE